MWRWILIAVAVLFVLSVLALWSWGHFAQRARGQPSTALPVAADATRLDRLIAPLLAAQAPGASGAALISHPEQAFVARARGARAAERSLDVQYYIWRHDLTGRLLENELLAAADRGVRVRLLIDDMNVAGRDDILLAMDAHPNLEVRIFNPARSRAGGLRRAIEMGLRFVGFNRRMHNKAWIADNRLAIVGGRNVGDEYFGASENTNFQDADLLMVGPAVAQTSAIFDAFWNSAAVVPLGALHEGSARLSPEALAAERRKWLAEVGAQPWVKALAANDDTDERLRRGAVTFYWTPNLRVVSDPPEKAAPVASRRERAAWLLYDVNALLYSARHDSWLISPYFVPGEAGTLMLAGQAARGMQVRVLTNSLAANDVPLVHAGYIDYRAALLAQGVSLYELKPGASSPDRELIGSSGASLHTKAFVVDGQRGFVGSFNFDPRSAQLNTEMGVMFDHPALAAEVKQMFDHGTRPESAWRVTLAEDGSLRWHGAAGRVWTEEPETGAGLRLLVWLMSFLPIESQL
ncbi:phospholipase D family protein [Ottowia sp. VDI28]|uniref:phospholipase D family protein n=1 Tax=Ottowia sp. VDI28 TaxID=3133968 RepID=UPI003C2DDB09